MLVVVADTGPLQYLVLIGQIELLAELYGGVTVPTAVHGELLHPAAPEPVRGWANVPPAWLTITPTPACEDPQLGKLDAGEAAAITLALTLPADLVLDQAAQARTDRHCRAEPAESDQLSPQAGPAGRIAGEPTGRQAADHECRRSGVWTGHRLPPRRR